MSTAARWLRSRVAGAPEKLRDAMIASVTELVGDAEEPGEDAGVTPGDGAHVGGAALPAGKLAGGASSVPPPPLPDLLAAGAFALYRRVTEGTGGREDALPLLAADALFTHAFQAQAELDPAGVADFARRWGGAALEDLCG